MLKQLTIIGNATPEIGVQHQYSLMDFMLSYDDPHFPENPETEWNIHVLEDGEWRKTTGSAKYGDVVYYTFTQKSLTRKGIKLIATQGENTGELILKPKSAGTPKIVRIELLDINGEPPTNPMNYTDTLIARAYCTDMEAQTLYFTLWEDDAEGAGHNSINKNINTLPVPAMVKKGVAEARFNMATYTMASIIANMQIAKGDKNEGKNHEYYVTAEYLGKLEAGNNVNIANPAYRPNAEDLPKLPNRNPTPTPAPKKDTYKTNLTSGSKTKAPDPKGKIVKVSFVDEKGNPVFDLKGIKNIIANIETKNMVGKTIKLTIWEDDTFSNDAVWSEVVKIEKDIYRASIPVKDIWEKGSKYELGDGSTQEYFIEVEYAGEELKSGVITVDKDAPRTKPNSGNSVVKVEGAEKEKKEEEKKNDSNEKGTIVIVSGTDKKKEKDPAQNIYWMVYKTSVYRNLSLDTYKKLKQSGKLPTPDYITYLTRDTHQTYSKRMGGTLKHSDKRFGTNNEVPPGEYFLVPGITGQTYKVYVIDSESKSAASADGIAGADGDRGGIALHQYCPRFSVGCFTFNSGKSTAPVEEFIKQVPDLKLDDDRPVRFIVEPREVEETTWDNANYGTKKWTGI